MSVQNDYNRPLDIKLNISQDYSQNDIRSQINSSPTIGGPPIFEDEYEDIEIVSRIESPTITGYINVMNPTSINKVNDEFPKHIDKYIIGELNPGISSTETDYVPLGNNNVDSLTTVGCTIGANGNSVIEHAITNTMTSPIGYVGNHIADSPTGCTGEDFTLYSQVQRSIDCVIASEGSDLISGSLAYATNLPTKAPISCMLNLLNGPYSQCGATIPDDKRQLSYDVFTEITGYKPIDLNHVFNDLNEEQKTILIFNAFYIFMPMLIIILIAIWLMVGFGWFNWVIGIFLTVSAILIIYIFSVVYRIHVQNYLNSRADQRKRDADIAQNNFQNSIAYWPQGLFGVACAITATGTTGWKCNSFEGNTELMQTSSVKNKMLQSSRPKSSHPKSNRKKRNSNCGCKGNAINNKIETELVGKSSRKREK